ncbi:GNAT family N-acetyltransferase [Streptomyces sp. NPDC021080]|uniref:GNAT family N-acetyltransferase n=1 Tax=Streptomyces sp. NPDC021080 TaxID=3365110 RepID=UPI0037A8B0D6
MIPLPGDHFPAVTGSTLHRRPGDRPLKIRPVTESDLPEVLRLDEQAFPEGPYTYDILRQWLDVCGERLLVADDGRALHGYIAVAATPNATRTWILSLAVAPVHRGHGLGRRLMLETLRHLRSDGVREVWLTVAPSNTTAIVLYRSLGFAPVGGIHEDYLGPGRDRLVLMLSL